MARLQVPVQLRWSDLDAYAHVNNVAMLTLLEEARIAAFWSRPSGAPAPTTAVLDAGPGADSRTLVARQEIDYRLPLGYQREPVTVVLWLGHLGGASMDVCYEVRDLAPEVPGSAVFARAVSTVVLVDASSGRPRRMTEQERGAWAPYLEAPVELRRTARHT
ncbi:MAG: acyl-CoA thioesterase [Actinobacteria bacterium]|nr:acyl-CoA thioesterase [Actinomycetota bacterium]MCG2799763.1 acyl-CoA thioesterase [Cellulomonas sp.]